MNFQEGDIFETVTVSQLGQVDGSALFKIAVCYGADMLGRFVELESCGASQAHASILMSLGFPQRSQAAPGGIIHLCRCRIPGCQQTFGNRPVYHVDMLGWRCPPSIGEAWATNLPPVEQEEADAAVEALDNFDDRVAELRRRLLTASEGQASDSESSRRRTPAQRLIETAERHERGRERCRRTRRDRSRC